MGRITVYRTDVEKARNALITRGIHPSGDAVRVELGNTGSKSTIHKYLRGIESANAANGDQEKMLSKEIADVVTKLAGRLKEEADTRITEARTACDEQLKASAEALAKEKAEIHRLVGAADGLEANLENERVAHAETRELLHAATVTIGQLEERVAGLEIRIGEHDAHAKSLEAKHQQAREALEHFRAAAKEQREQDQRRHEHYAQGLQLELRQAADAGATKNEDILRLNRDNARLNEQVGQHDKDLRQLRADLRERDHELQTLRPIAADQKALQTRCVQAEHTVMTMTTELADLRKALANERDARQLLEVERARAATLDEVVARLSRAAPDAVPASAT